MSNKISPTFLFSNYGMNLVATLLLIPEGAEITRFVKEMIGKLKTKRFSIFIGTNISFNFRRDLGKGHRPLAPEMISTSKNTYVMNHVILVKS